MGGGKLVVVVGGQFGSEGKGAIAGYLARESRNLTAIRVGGPNAGHTVYDALGQRFALRQLPVAAVTNHSAQVAIAAGSEIDPLVLQQECDLLANAVVMIDPQATLLCEDHKRTEAQVGLQERIGSTGKGIGAARADRLMRAAPLVTADALMGRNGEVLNGAGVLIDVASVARHRLRERGTVMVEAGQGFGLGLHAGYYPKCTSCDCRAIDALSMAGVSPWDGVDVIEVWVVLRTFPIRVAGDSGPLIDELKWEYLAKVSGGYIQPERTTVTNKVRRIGAWDSVLAARAVAANGGRPMVHVALTMADYWWPTLANTEDPARLGRDQWTKLIEIGRELQAPVELVGTGPRTLIDLRKV